MSYLYPLRERIRYMLPIWVIKTYDNIRFWFNPRQKWLTKQIPNHWMDKDTLWEICILSGIVHYVEKDGGLGFNPGDYENSQKNSDYPEHQKSFDREVKWAYDQIKITLPKLEYQLKEAWDKIPTTDPNNLNKNGGRSYDEIYGETDRLEKEIANLKTKIMVWAVEKREWIWT